MAKLSWFPFYANEFLSSTKIAVMSTEEIGAYLLLLCHAWNDPRCSLPDDDEMLRKLGRLSGDVSRVRACFVKRFKRLVNQKLLDVWMEQQAKHALMSECGIRGNVKRWGSPGESGGDRQASRVGIAKGSQSESESESEKEIKRKRKRDKLPQPEHWSLSEAMKQYATLKGMTPSTARHEFEKCQLHHRESRFSASGWEIKTWQTWVLNWISFGSKQIEAIRPASCREVQRSDPGPFVDPPPGLLDRLRGIGKGMN